MTSASCFRKPPPGFRDTGDGFERDRSLAPPVAVVATQPTDQRALLLARRQALIIELGAIEEYLGMERSIMPRRKR
jgi:hypothetical protein